jgi:hypothetical protein
MDYHHDTDVDLIETCFMVLSHESHLQCGLQDSHIHFIH